MYEYQAPTYGDYEYPEWAVYVGWGLAGISLVQIPLWALLTILYYLCKWVSSVEDEWAHCVRRNEYNNGSSRWRDGTIII